MGVAVNIKELYIVKDIKLIVIITYYCESFQGFPLGRMSFHQPLTSYQKDIDVALIIKEFHNVENIKDKVMLASVGGVYYLYDYWFHY